MVSIVLCAEIIPKRESSRREAKEKAKERRYTGDIDDDDIGEIEEEIIDSDSDPAWTPSKVGFPSNSPLK